MQVKSGNSIAIIFGWVMLATIAGGCGASSPIRALRESETIVSASVGGPIVPSTVPTIVIPYATAGVSHGITPDLTVTANAHLLMAAFAVGGLDVGGCYRVIAEHNGFPELTAGAQLLTYADFTTWSNVRIYPNVHFNLSWDVADSTLVYGGSHLTFQWTPYAAYVSPFLGVQFPIAKSTSIQVEGMWQAANVNTAHGIFEGESSINHTGSISGFIGVVFKL